MRVLISKHAVADAHKKRDRDYHFTQEGELLWAFLIADSDRGFSGVETLKGATIGVVAELDAAEVTELIAGCGFLRSWGETNSIDDMLTALDALSDELVPFALGEAVRLERQGKHGYRIVPADDGTRDCEEPGNLSRPSGLATGDATRATV
jgi:hypothetical protein